MKLNIYYVILHNYIIQNKKHDKIMKYTII